MTKHANPTWKEIVPIDNLPFTKWFLHAFVDQVRDHTMWFSTEDDRKLFRDWNHFNWIEYYDKMPSVLAQLGTAVSGIDNTSPPCDQFQSSSDFLDHMKHTVAEAKKIAPGSKKEQKLHELIIPKLLPFKLEFIVIANHFVCAVKYKTTIHDLIDEIREGCEEAIFVLISIDHIFLELPEVRNRIREATLFNDEDFLYELGRAVEQPSVRMELPDYKDDILLLLAWNLGFETVGLEQFGIFLREIGFTRFSDTSSLRKKLNRLGISTKKQKKTPKGK
ncbi:MAG: hypothetical protein KAR42_05820 [candidate division Zixibacteria bacterium]|nr:hypothetical protein [candidate division Zixibacteria bacterium]